jgi:hypothetical protein
MSREGICKNAPKLRLEFGLQTKFGSTSEQNIYSIRGMEKWNSTIHEHMQNLSTSQATVLVLLSFGKESCAQARADKLSLKYVTHSSLRLKVCVPAGRHLC